MESMLVVLVILLIILNLGIIYFLTRKKEKEQIQDTTQILKDEINLLKSSFNNSFGDMSKDCLLYTSPSPRDATLSRMPSSA